MLLSSDARWFWEQMFYWSKSSTDHKIVCELIGGRWWKKKYKSCNSKFHLVFLLFSFVLVKEPLEAMNIYVPNLTETFIPTDPRSQWIKQHKATERFHIQLWNWAFYFTENTWRKGYSEKSEQSMIHPCNFHSSNNIVSHSLIMQLDTCVPRLPVTWLHPLIQYLSAIVYSCIWKNTTSSDWL